jgi:trehalose utilization protein
MTLNVTIWNEFRHEKTYEEVRKVYPDGLHAPIASHLRSEGMTVRVATLDESEHGLTDAVLADTDVLTWWGHLAHGEVGEEIISRVQQRVLDGMGLIVLHSAHFSKNISKTDGHHVQSHLARSE